jgi:hypothetical protein
MPCPDANLDGEVNSIDVRMVAKTINDTGVDSGAVLADGINDHQTSGIAISDQSALVVGDTISIEAEQMTVSALYEGSPDTMTAVRGVNRTKGMSHNPGARIFRATYDGSWDGVKGYTNTRDFNDDGIINSIDFSMLARVIVTGIMCPAP